MSRTNYVLTVGALCLGLVVPGLQASTIFDGVSGSWATAGQFNLLMSTGTLTESVGNGGLWQQGTSGGLLNIGFGSGAKLSESAGTVTIDANLMFASTSSITTNAGVTCNCVITTGVSAVTSAISAATSLAGYWALNGGGGATAGNSTALPTSGTINASGPVSYYTAGNVNLNSLTINGTADQLVIINITGNLKFQGNVTLTGGLTVDNVLFNVTSGGSFLTSNSVGTVNADIIGLNSTQDNLTAGTGTFDGRIFDLGSSNAALNLGANLSGPAAISMPEPATLTMMVPLAGLLGLGGLLRKRFQR